MLKKTLLISTLTLSLNAFSAGYTGPAKINWMSAIGLSSHQGELGGSWGNPDNCTAPSKFIFGTHPQDDDITVQAKYSMLLGAYLSGQTVEFYVDGCNAYGQPIIHGLYIPARNP